jgi:hypothetical protein
MKMQLDESLVTIKPSFRISAIMSERYKRKAFKSISSISNALSKATKGETQKQIDGMLAKLKLFSISSAFYSYNSRLVNSLTKLKNINQTQDILDDLSAQDINHLISYYPRITNLDTYDFALDFSMDTVNDYKKINPDRDASIFPVSKIDFEKNIEIIYQAISVLKTEKMHPFYEEICNYVSDIIIFDGTNISGGTSSRFMGSVFIRIPKIQKENKSGHTMVTHLTPLLYYLEQLIHETAHLHLDHLMEFDPIILNDENEKFDSPLRIDKRPMRGVFHATFVLARLKILFSILNNLSKQDEALKHKRLLTIQNLLNDGISTIKNYAALTQNGEKLLSEMTQITLA